MSSFLEPRPGHPGTGSGRPGNGSGRPREYIKFDLTGSRFFK